MEFRLWAVLRAPRCTFLSARGPRRRSSLQQEGETQRQQAAPAGPFASPEGPAQFCPSKLHALPAPQLAEVIWILLL